MKFPFLETSHSVQQSIAIAKLSIEYQLCYWKALSIQQCLKGCDYGNTTENGTHQGVLHN